MIKNSLTYNREKLLINMSHSGLLMKKLIKMNNNSGLITNNTFFINNIGYLGASK